MSKRRCPECDEFVPDICWKVLREPKYPEYDDEREGYDNPGIAWLVDEVPCGLTWRRFACAKCGYTVDTVELSVETLLEITEDSPTRSEYLPKKPPKQPPGPMKLQSSTEVGPHRVVKATDVFASIVGPEDQPRSRAVAKFWAYVQGNKLVKPDRPNIITADHNLLDAFRMFRGRRELEMKDVPDFFYIHLND